MKSILDRIVNELLSTSKPEPVPQRDRSFDVKNLFQGSGRLRYDAVKAIAKSHNILFFSELLEKPVLAGASLFQAAMISRGKQQDNETFLASFSENSGGGNIKKEGALETAVYLLLKMENLHVDNLFIIGRDKDNDIVIPDYSVSRKHAHIRFDETGKYFIKDQDSTNGTVVNGTAIHQNDGEILLAPLDQIIFGRYEFLFLTPPYFYAKLLGLDYQSIQKK